MKEYEGNYKENDEVLEWDQLITASKKETKTQSDKKRNIKKRIITVSIVFVCIISMYLTVVYSDHPFIDKWRTIYIETAMTTTRHK